jgi:tetratricopeptide (TPR) repeat protein
MDVYPGRSNEPEGQEPNAPAPATGSVPPEISTSSSKQAGARPDSPPPPESTKPSERESFWRDLIKEFRTGIIAASVAAVIGIPAWIFGARETIERWWWQVSAAEPAPGNEFTILVADITGDTDREQTQLLAEALEDIPGLRVIMIPRTLELPSVGSLNEGLTEAQRSGQEWMERWNGDLLVWGRDTGTTLRLRFLPRGGQVSAAHGSSRFGEEVELPRQFSDAVGTQLEALVLTSAAPVLEQRGQYLVESLSPVAEKLRKLAESDTSVVPIPRGRLLTSLGLVTWTLGEQTKRAEFFEESVDAFQNALTEYPRDRVPLEWATVQSRLGIALAGLGSREMGTARLEQAVAAFREALKERTRDRAPLAWATTQNNLGNVLTELGKREGNPARLEQAVAAYREALEERTRDRVPMEWAETQNNLGAALWRLGVRESDPAFLQQGVVAFREALKEWTRDRVPLFWATAQHNLGGTLADLGSREKGMAFLEQAVVAFREALKERTRARTPLDWADTQYELGTTLWNLGAREGGTERLEQAAVAFEAALSGYSAVRADNAVRRTESALTAVRSLIAGAAPSKR